MATDDELGEDWGGVDDITSGLDDVTGRLALLQCVARRWYDLAGSHFYDRDLGKGMSLWLNSAMTSPSSIESALEDEARKDERVETCDVTVTFDSTRETLTIKGRITDADGLFAFTVAASALTTTALLENA